MPGLIQKSTFDQLKITPIHATFGAEVEGVDFANLSDEVYNEILAAMAKVSEHS